MKERERTKLSLQSIAKIGGLWQTVVDVASEGLKVVTDFAEVAAGVGDAFGKIMKITMIAGGAFLFWWLLIKKDKKKR